MAGDFYVPGFVVLWSFSCVAHLYVLFAVQRAENDHRGLSPQGTRGLYAKPAIGTEWQWSGL